MQTFIANLLHAINNRESIHVGGGVFTPDELKTIVSEMRPKVRYFVLSYELEDADIVECSEQEFLAHDGRIEYERHTVRENGASQICLTKI
jgi:hypothetical protein